MKCVILYICNHCSYFLLYEVFVREEANNLDLSTRLQRHELESNHFKEINIMYTDINKWRHEYKNNLIALKSIIVNKNDNEAVEYIDKIFNIPMYNDEILQTGNLILDAVVSSKLWYAKSSGIKT